MNLEREYSGLNFVQRNNFRLIKTCLQGTQIKVRIGNCLSSSFPIKSFLKQGNALSPLTMTNCIAYGIRCFSATFTRALQ